MGNFSLTNDERVIALAAFITTAILVSRLVARGREQAARAEARASEVEAVNALSVSLLARAHELQSLGRAAARGADRDRRPLGAASSSTASKGTGCSPGPAKSLPPT